MSDIAFPLCLLLGMLLGIPAAWLVGLFNPFGYLGTLPWRVPTEARVFCAKHGMRNCFCRRQTDDPDTPR